MIRVILQVAQYPGCCASARFWQVVRLLTFRELACFADIAFPSVCVLISQKSLRPKAIEEFQSYVANYLLKVMPEFLAASVAPGPATSDAAPLEAAEHGGEPGKHGQLELEHYLMLLSWALSAELDKEVAKKLRGFTRDMEEHRKEVICSQQLEAVLDAARSFSGDDGQAEGFLTALAATNEADDNLVQKLLLARQVLLSKFVARCNKGDRPVALANDRKLLETLSDLVSKKPNALDSAVSTSTLLLLNVGLRLCDVCDKVEDFASSDADGPWQDKYDVFMGASRCTNEWNGTALVKGPVPADHADFAFVSPWTRHDNLFSSKSMLVFG
jgi:hypothetical protein